MVPTKSDEQPMEAVPMHKLFKPVVFHDGRLVCRPTPLVALLTLVYIPIGFILSVIRVLICVNVPLKLVPLMYKILGIKLVVRGPIPRGGDEKGSCLCVLIGHVSTRCSYQ